MPFCVRCDFQIVESEEVSSSRNASRCPNRRCPDRPKACPKCARRGPLKNFTLSGSHVQCLLCGNVFARGTTT
jgi:hypothetical protein